MPRKLSELQRKILQRFSDGDTVASRLNYMFCDKASRYVQVFRTDHSVAPSRTLTALWQAGYLGVGYVITESGRDVLANAEFCP